ncbi:sterol desaturase family protein [Mucilaginibacter sp. P25]|uniref:Fatty acid hydroxylase superfamily protein n=1 Tax=Mucilaginibacter gossypii TaxID=551996 RepID=A0A1G7MSW1_9SPHI|nr:MULTISPECIES: sterol desaturase family protein [Mucilaginibacter]QTE39548.1 sterol desaturase family protein [Mucilaginibacter gossypii]RAV56093.1 fatty acid hydroxylase [Mucilaginibacter rubeus]SDF64885.1 Fatty acid hydroxylase superfamily protein [Mucilaginibacter gossypii]
MKKKYISNSQESVRMFKSDFLEGLSKVHYTVPLYIFVPVIGYCSYKFFDLGLDILTYIGLFIFGLFIWTITEYIMHRFVFHYQPSEKLEWAQRLHFIMHGVHHDYPSDAKRLVLPPSLSIPLATGFFFLFKWLLPVNYIWGFFPGFILGYLFYDISHYAMHHFNFKSGLFKKIKQHHMLHHYQDPEKGYGVSSPFWDKIFRSDFLKK